MAIDVLERVLNGGIVIDATMKVSLAGIELVGVDACVIVASIETYLRWSHRLAAKPCVPAAGPATSSTPNALRRQTRPAASETPNTPRRQTRARGPRLGTRRAIVRLSCHEGCTFTRTRLRIPRAVRCPYQTGHVCRVQRI
jgi:hypothetical protein